METRVFKKLSCFCSELSVVATDRDISRNATHLECDLVSTREKSEKPDFVLIIL